MPGRKSDQVTDRFLLSADRYSVAADAVICVRMYRCLSERRDFIGSADNFLFLELSLEDIVGA